MSTFRNWIGHKMTQTDTNTDDTDTRDVKKRQETVVG